jgi:hypothetical protein
MTSKRNIIRMNLITNRSPKTREWETETGMGIEKQRRGNHLSTVQIVGVHQDTSMMHCCPCAQYLVEWRWKVTGKSHVT